MMTKRKAPWAMASLVIAGAGCNSSSGTEALATVSRALYGQATNISVPTGMQSETAGTADRGNDIYVAYNGSDEANVSNPTPTSKRICRGATQMRYSRYSASQHAWFSGAWLAPPTNIAVLWGDPALATYTAPSSGAQTIFYSFLASPVDHYNLQVDPADGCILEHTTDTVNLMELALAGACVAHASAGAAFDALTPADCFGETRGQPSSSPTDFYDGGFLVSTRNNVYAAYEDGGQTVVWRTPAPTINWTRLGVAPLGALMWGGAHPIMVADGSRVYVLAPTGSGAITMVRFDENAGTWSTPFMLIDHTSMGLFTTLSNGTTTIRERGFSAALESRPGQPPVLYVFYKTKVGFNYQVQALSCLADGSWPPTCGRSPALDQAGSNFNAFMPAVASANFGYPDGPPQTWITYWREDLSNPGLVKLAAHLLNPDVSIVFGTAQPVCPTGGYWGDFDTVTVTMSGVTPVFNRGITDSTAGSCTSGFGVASPQHVSLVPIKGPPGDYDSGEFFDQDYIFSGSIVECDQFYYKGQCVGDYGALGLSTQPGGGAAHGILCKQGPPGLFSSGTVATLALGGDHRRAQRLGDWDGQHYKLECGNNEYVSGASQNPVGHAFHAVRCSPSFTGLSNNGCHTQAFNNSGAAGAGDWDVAFTKAECSRSEYMAGVSADTKTLQPHLILCCRR